MEHSRQFPHSASRRHISDHAPPKYQESIPSRVSALPAAVLSQVGANTQPIFYFDDIPCDSSESIPSGALSQRGRSQWSTQTRFAHDHHHHHGQHLTADSHYRDHPTHLDPRRATPYPQMMSLSGQPRPPLTDASRRHDRYPRDEFVDEQLISGSPVSHQPTETSYQSSADQPPPPLHLRAHGTYEQSLAPHLDWREVEISAAIRRQDMGHDRGQNWSQPLPQNTYYLASRSKSTTGYLDHMSRSVIGRCEACGYKDHLYIVERHRKSCTGPRYR